MFTYELKRVNNSIGNCVFHWLFDGELKSYHCNIDNSLDLTCDFFFEIE